MPKKRSTAEQIIGKLREIEVLQVQGMSICHASGGIALFPGSC